MRTARPALPFASVIVPVRNEGAAIEATLRALLTQDYPAERFEVIVADGGSEDETVPIVRRLQGQYPNLKFVFNPVCFSSGGRNVAIRHMRGDFAVIVDGHCQVPAADYLRNLALAFETSGADTLGRPQPLDAPDATHFQQAVSVARASRIGHNPSSDIYSDEPKFVDPSSTAVAYRWDVFLRVGLFDEQFDACEDVEFNHRVKSAGLTCYFEPKLKVGYHPRKSLAALFRQLGRYGRGRARLAAKHADSLTIPALVPPLWAAWVVVGLLAVLSFPNFAPVYLGLLVLYALVVVGGSIGVSRNMPLPVRLRVPVVFVGIHFGFAWGFVKEVFERLISSPRQARRAI